MSIIPFRSWRFRLIFLWLVPDAPVWLVVVAFCAYAFASGGPSILEWIYPNELFPTEIRATAVGVSVGISRIGAATGTYCCHQHRQLRYRHHHGLRRAHHAGRIRRLLRVGSGDRRTPARGDRVRCFRPASALPRPWTENPYLRRRTLER